jgi:5'-3' exonuclease
LREEIHFGAKSKSHCDNELTDPVNDVAQELIFVSINETRKAYNEELCKAISNHKLVTINMPTTTDFSNDLIFICFLLGNDFLPHFPSIDIHRGGLDELVSCYVNCVAETNTLLINFNKNDKVEINNVFLLLLIQKLGSAEQKHFQYELPKHLDSINKRKCFAQDKYLKDIWILENLKNADICDPVGLGIGNEEDWKFRYYEHYFYSSEHQGKFVDRLCFTYLEGVAWVTQYYFNKCIDWQWQFPYDNAPFISDIGAYIGKFKFDINVIEFQKKESIPMMAQLISVLPPACYKLLPKSYQFLVTNQSSPIIDMFPIKVQLDMLYKDQHWQCIPKIPYLNIDRILKTVHGKKMSTSEKTRSKILDNFKFINN